MLNKHLIGWITTKHGYCELHFSRKFLSVTIRYPANHSTLASAFSCFANMRTHDYLFITTAQLYCNNINVYTNFPGRELLLRATSVLEKLCPAFQSCSYFTFLFSQQQFTATFAIDCSSCVILQTAFFCFTSHVYFNSQNNCSSGKVWRICLVSLVMA